MTDGILLAETQGDRFLDAYDTIIVDEAHERSLNIDFLLGYLKWLLPRRPDLKIIITSATIDPERFSKHFGDAPIINVSGRSYPVELRYRPVELDEEDDETATAEQDAILRGRRRAVAASSRATSWCSSAASARSARRPNRCASTTRRAARSCRCIRACRRKSSSACSGPRAGAASCSPPMSPRPR